MVYDATPVRRAKLRVVPFLGMHRLQTEAILSVVLSIVNSRAAANIGSSGRNFRVMRLVRCDSVIKSGWRSGVGSLKPRLLR
jgi:hypothetical protein